VPGALALAALLAGAGGAGAGGGRAAAPCAPPGPSAAAVRRTAAVLRAGRDVWGEQLLARPGGPTYAAAARYLPPLFFARGPGGAALTDSGAYYLPFADPEGPRGAAAAALHVADGSQVVARRAGGPALTVRVGPGGAERFGSCLARLGGPALAGGWLPVLETRYADAAGARYRQESFAARDPTTRALASFVRVTADARRSRRPVAVRLASPRGAVRLPVPRGAVRTVEVEWPLGGAPRRVGEAAFAAARGSVVSSWRDRLAAGASVSLPERRVEDALRALLVQGLVLTWRYSIGNPYEEFSFPESVDVAQVLDEYGFGAVARSILRTSLTRRPVPYPNWKAGERLLASAEHVRLTGDRAYLDAATPALRGFAASLGRQIESGPTGLLDPERYSSDIPDTVYGLHSQAVAWAGLRAMGDVWGEAGRPGLAARCRRLAARLGPALLDAVRRSERRLPDGSLFLPARLLGGERPYGSLTETRLGSYWNLVVPYALASGLFPPGGARAEGALRYLLAHGSRLLGLVRAGAYALYGRDAAPPASGTDEVYGINVARFLADAGEADQLVLSLYGELAAGMTRNTFVAGEAASVAPLRGERLRSMYLPPNAAAGAAFLETLRVMLVHETADGRGRPHGLELAFSTPRGWLGPGRRIAVAGMPTSFGPVSYELAAGAGSVRAVVAVPPRRPASLRLRLRLPGGARIGAVTVGGRPFARVDRTTGTLDLSGLRGRLEIAIRLRSP